MMILGKTGQKLMHKQMKNPDANIKLMGSELTDVDFEEEAKTTVNMEQLKKDGAKNGGECSLAEASKRFLNLSNILISEGKANILRQSSLYHDASVNLTTDPSKSCTLTKELALKYEVPFKKLLKEPKLPTD
jgi:hypothetical protein